MAATHLKRLIGDLHRAVESRELDALDDAELLDRFRLAGSAAAFEAIVRRYGERVLAAGRQVLDDPADVDDVFQAAFLVLLNQGQRIRKGQSLGGWLFGVAHRLALQARRGVARRRRAEARKPAPFATEAADLSWREACAILHEELNRLPDTYRVPLLLCYIEGRTRDDAAKQLGVKADVIRGRLERGRDRLRARLTRRGVTLSAGLLAAIANPATAGAPPPASLVRSTLDAACAGSASASITRLVKGGTTSMGLSNVKLTVAVAAIVGMVSAGAYMASSAAPPGAPGAAPPAANSAADEKTKQTTAERLDQFGDPLPPDAIARLGTTRFAFAHHANSVAYAKDGKTIVVAIGHGAVVMDAVSGKRLRSITTSNGVRSLAISPDGKLLALQTSGPSVKPGALKVGNLEIWDTQTGTVLRQCMVPRGSEQFDGLIFSPDGKRLAAHVVPRNSARVWDVATGKQLLEWGAAGESGGACFSADSQQLIAGYGRRMIVLDIAASRAERFVDYPGGNVYRLALAPDGKTLATQVQLEASKAPFKRGGGIQLWDTASLKLLRQIEVVPDATTRQAKRSDRMSEELEAVTDFRWSPDSKTLATAGADGVIRFWDAELGKEARHCDTGEWVSGIGFSPDGKTLASVGGDYTVHLWEAATGKSLREHASHRHGLRMLALSQDGRILASANGNDFDTRPLLWDTMTGRQLRQIVVPDNSIVALHFSSHGSLTTIGKEKVRSWDRHSGDELRQLQLPSGGEGRHILSPDGKTWASTFDKDKSRVVVLWDAATGKQRSALKNTGSVVAVAFAADGATLCSWDQRLARSWDVKTGQLLREFDIIANDAAIAGFSADGKWLAHSGSIRPGQVCLFLHDMATGAVAHRIEFKVKGPEFTSLAFAPDGRCFAVAEGGTIHLVESATGKFRRRLTGGHDRGITALLFSADGQRLISGSTDTTAIVWDLTGRINLKPAAPTAADVDAWWAALAGDDVEAAYEAIRRLAAGPNEAIPFLASKLKPTASADAKAVARLIAELDSDRFSERDRASRELEKLGDSATALCRAAAARDVTPETRRRLEALLEKTDRERRALSSERLRIIRALEALELSGAPEARQLLRQLAAGAVDAFMTHEANGPFERTSKQAALRP
jgi:RNA polymerase sigma factor (sigma-70 family)